MNPRILQAPGFAAVLAGELLVVAYWLNIEWSTPHVMLQLVAFVALMCVLIVFFYIDLFLLMVYGYLGGV